MAGMESQITIDAKNVRNPTGNLTKSYIYSSINKQIYMCFPF